MINQHRFIFAGLLLVGLLLSSCTSPTPNTALLESDADEARRTRIESDGAPAAIGPYSQAILVGDLLFCAGQIGLDPETGQMVDGGIEAETRRVMDNLSAVLEEAGYSMADVVQSQVFMADLEEYGVMNEIYASYFADSPPARAAVQVARLPRDARIEIMMTAAK